LLFADKLRIDGLNREVMVIRQRQHEIFRQQFRPYGSLNEQLKMIITSPHAEQFFLVYEKRFRTGDQENSIGTKNYASFVSAFDSNQNSTNELFAQVWSTQISKDFASISSPLISFSLMECLLV
jgi:hypothetical protein